jgi:hypothetical protein
MFPFLSQAEIGLIQSDFTQMLQGEGSLVTLTYRTPLLAGSSPDPDPVYKFDRRLQDNDLETVSVRCFIQIVHARDLKILGFGIVQVGDAILYFLDTLNLQEPNAGKPVLPSTLFITDPHGNKWSPVIDAGPLKNYLAMTLNNRAISQVVPCVLLK